MRRDLVYAVRALLKNRAFTVLALISLALGIGANTAIFSVINATLLHPVPYPDPSRLVLLYTKEPKVDVRDFPASGPDFKDWRSRNTVFRSMAAMRMLAVNLTSQGEPDRVLAARVTSDWFRTLGLNPVMGRGFTAAEDRRGGNVTVISDELWNRRFGRSRDVLGKSITVDGAAHTIIGVMPPDATFGPVELWRPLTFTEDPSMQERGSHNFRVIARLKRGVTFAEAQDQMSAIASRLAAEYPAVNAGVGVTLWPVVEQAVQGIRPALLILLGAVGLVLLIACANAANLLLARVSGRRREIAIREALGASRWRLARLLLTESLVLSLAAGAGGWLLALWGVEALRRLIPQGTQLGATPISVDGIVLAFVLGISVLCSILFGAGPALAASRQDANENLKEGGRSATSGVSGQRIRWALAAGEIALSLTLLIGAGLLLKSLVHLISADPGFRAEHVLTAGIVPTGPFDPQAWRRDVPMYTRMIERFSALPGVARAAFASMLPLEGHNEYDSFEIEGQPRMHLADLPIGDKTIVTPEYFDVMGIPVLRGRGVKASDAENTQNIAVIDQSAARAYWPREDPIGKRIRYFEGENRPGPWLTIVGVVGAVKHVSIIDAPTPTIYVPLEQFPYPGMQLVVRTTGDPARLASAVRVAVHAVRSDLPVVGLQPAQEIVNNTTWRQRFATQVIGLFAALALVMALVGAYGVILYSVSQRVNEFGIRIALGAGRQDILGMVLRDGLLIGGAGTVVGLAAAAVMARALQALLFQVSPTDLGTFVSCGLLMLATALVASYLPARRATKVDPMTALRCE
ncbi:MAG TPA: ABC transporter permease [Bryobacteraceae bacterium]|nr:ABC transporter permease [Bryobacteraceae bacterium]